MEESPVAHVFIIVMDFCISLWAILDLCIRKYERELKRLRAELEEKNRNVVDKRRLLELDEQRRRAEVSMEGSLK